MADLRNIWRHLQDHEIAPPADVPARLRALLPLETMRPPEGMLPPEAIIPMEGVLPDIDMKGNLNRLGQLELQPPAFLLPSIEKLIAGVSPAAHSGTSSSSSSGPAAAIPLRKNKLFRIGFRAAAACLLLIAASWGIFRAINGRKPEVALAGKEAATNGSSAGKSTPSAITDSLSAHTNPVMADSAGNTALSGNTHAVDSNTIAVAGKYRSHYSVNVNGQSLHLTDNDVLYTLCTFKYKEVPAFLTAPDKESLNSSEGLKIHIDQYANIFISKPMLGMMQDMNTFKSNGELARKGRKARAKLDNWKKADVKQFDQSLKNNPLDPIDLANFIFK